MKKTLLLASLAFIPLLHAAAPSFRTAAVPDGWRLVKGEVERGTVRNAKPATPMELRTESAVSLPVEATFAFRAAALDALTFQAIENAVDAKDSKPLLAFAFRISDAGKATVSAHASGEPMATTAVHQKGWSVGAKHSGAIGYGWRFPKVKNLWDEADRKEIGASYAKLVPFEEKTFWLRMVLTAEHRQLWLDDRLVAEQSVASPKQAFFSIVIPAKSNAQVLSAEFGVSAATGRFTPVPLAHWSHAKTAQGADDAAKITQMNAVPVSLAPATVDVSLGDSLYRYRRTHGSGPNAGYVNALCSWPAPFEIDPASLTFRVPHRSYQTAWLVAWVDDVPDSTPSGTFRFYRPDGGYPAQTHFEITDAAIAKGDVKPLRDKTPDGKPLYLVRVPLDTAGLYGMRDMAGQFLDFEVCKPVTLTRSYPDPIYYGDHPAGLRSSVHIAAITLEEAPFDFEVKPAQTGFVFEQPQQPAAGIAIRNTGSAALDAIVTVHTKSHDGAETATLTKTAHVPAGQTVTPELAFTVKRLGWHELKVSVEAGGATRECTLSMVVLPPNTRTYGTAQNEVRFGTWNLLGHYTPLRGNDPANEDILAMLRRLGLRKIALHRAFITPEMAKRHDFLPVGPHTVINVVYRWKHDDIAAQDKMVETELAAVKELCEQMDKPTYFYGGEWHVGRMAQYAPWPFYTGDGDRDLSEEERRNVEHQIPIFTKIGRALHKEFPQCRRILQWGAPLGTTAYMRAGIPKDIVDGYGMDAPMFELLPELSNMTGSINNLWWLRQEIKRLGWPDLPIHWCEGPFFPTNPGALTETEQMNYQLRYLLLGMCYGIEGFEAGIVPYDAGNYYGAEHYGAGVFHRLPLACPKPAVAAIATMTSMLCGADRTGNVETGSLTDYCVAFRHAKSGRKIFALWRVHGQVDATITIQGGAPVLTESMGNATKLEVKDGKVVVKLTSTPQWLTGVDGISAIHLGAPVFPRAKPAEITRPITDFAAAKWIYDGGEDKDYASHHFSVRRITGANLKAEFGAGEEGRADAVAITLPVEPNDRPMATRYGALKLKKPVVIPGKASALGVWMKGNSSWGRFVYQLKDAKGETWISHGTKDDWNCDDTHAWSYASFNGWRYVRFPLPGTHPWDSARGLETTWWASRGGDGIVDLPLTVEKIIVEARNEVPWCGEMKTVTGRSYKLSGLIAEYENEQDTTPAILAHHKLRMTPPVWVGPTDNPIAKLKVSGTTDAPDIREFKEPKQFNDGRRMMIHFDAKPGMTYNLYLSIYPDGRGADLLKAGVKPDDQVTGFRPEMDMYLFLTELDEKKVESKPSKAYKLITHDNFAEK